MPPDLQLQTLRLYGELVSRRETWPGALILTLGPGTSATGLPTAASIAGATSLTVDPDIPTVKSVFRQGGLDFVVNTLDEAIRVLKNEIRQGRPLAVALTADPIAIAAEISDRGLLPDLGVVFSNPTPQALEPRQTSPLALRTLTYNPTTPSPEYAAWLSTHHWQESTLERTTPAALTQLDATLSTMLEGTPRRRWLQQISRYQRPERTRHLWLTESEKASL